MNWNAAIRRFHGWVSIIFAVIVAGIFLAIGLGNEPASWIYFLPLLPLALLMLTGLWMFFLPYTAKRQRV